MPSAPIASVQNVLELLKGTEAGVAVEDLLRQQRYLLVAAADDKGAVFSPFHRPPRYTFPLSENLTRAALGVAHYAVAAAWRAEQKYPDALKLDRASFVKDMIRANLAMDWAEVRVARELLPRASEEDRELLLQRAPVRSWYKVLAGVSYKETTPEPVWRKDMEAAAGALALHELAWRAEQSKFQKTTTQRAEKTWDAARGTAGAQTAAPSAGVGVASPPAPAVARPAPPPSSSPSSSAGARFVAQRDVVVNGRTNAAGTCHLWTTGLAKRARPELELVDLPKEHAEDGGILLNNVAEYLVNAMAPGRTLKDGETLAVTVGKLNALLRARASTLPSGKAGFRFHDHGVKPVETVAAALATVKVARAWRMIDEGGDQAIALLDAAISLWPGSRELRDVRGPPGMRLNNENVFAYLLRASLTDDAEAASRDYRAALNRSEELEEGELGITRRALAQVGDAELAAAWRAAEMSAPVPGAMPGMDMFLSPIRLSSPRGELVSHVAILPKALARYASAPLSPAWVSVGRELVRHASTHAIAVLVASRETCWLYEQAPTTAPEARAPLKVLAPKAPPAAQLVSMVRADLQRRNAAGLNAEEVLAVYGRSENADAARRAGQKMATLRAAERQAFAKAMSGP